MFLCVNVILNVVCVCIRLHIGIWISILPSLPLVCVSMSKSLRQLTDGGSKPARVSFETSQDLHVNSQYFSRGIF